MQLNRENIIPLALGLLVLVASTMSGDWSSWVEGFFGILIIVFVVFGRQYFSLGTSWGSPNRWFAAFLAVAAAAAVWSANYYFSIRTWTIFFLGFLVFLAAQTLVTKHRDLLIRWYVGIAGFGSLWATVEQWRSGVSRAGGWLENANALGSYLILALPLSVGVALESKGKMRWLWWPVTAAIALALLRTFSLTGWVSLIVVATAALGLGGYRHIRVKHILWVLGGIVIFIFALVALRTVQYRSFQVGIRLDTAITAAHFESSFSQRWLFIRSSLDMVRAHPLTGVGGGVFQQAYPQFAYSLHEQPRYAHNAYLEVAAESGLFAAAFFIGLFFVLARQIWRHRAGARERFTLWPWVALAVGASAVHALFDFGWHFPVVWLGFWIFGGMLAGTLPVPAPSRSHRAFVGVLAVLVALLTFRALGVVYSFTPFQRAEAAMQQGRPAAAITYFSQGLRWDPNPQRRNHLAEALWQTAQGNADILREASAEIHRSLAWARTDYNAYRMAGRIALAQKDLSAADASYQRAVVLDGNFHPDIAGEYMAFLIQQERYADARRVASEVLQAYALGQWTNNPFTKGDLASIEAALQSLEGKE